MIKKIKILGNFLNRVFSENLFHPLFVHFECTYRCNMKCSFCNIWKKNLFPKEASTLEFKKRLLECWDLGCLVVSYTGGEPLLREDLRELLKFSSERIGFYTGLVTNGLLLDKKIDEISKYIDFLAVSFDANDEKIFNKTRGTNAFKKIKKNIELVKQRGIDINIFSVITTETFKSINKTIDFAKSLEIPIHFSTVDSVPREFLEISDAEKLKYDDSEKILKKLEKEKTMYKKIHFEPDYFRFQSKGGFNKFIRCTSASTTISLKPDGSVSLPCPFFTLTSISKNTNLRNGLNTKKTRQVIKNCGKWNFCNKCSINCMYVVSLLNHPFYAVRWIKNKF